MQPVHQGAPSARGRVVSLVFVRLFQLSLICGLLALMTGAVVPAPSTDVVSDRVGATTGTFGVSETGAATYSLPIFTTPGVAGFKPQVSLEYNSQGGDGQLGKGWSLAATSMITRCRAARETADFSGDNQSLGNGSGGLLMNEADKLCLDGQRLVPASVPASAGACAVLGTAIVTEYRTEIDSNQRVCAYKWTDALGSRFFTVERQDGTTSWYGDRHDTAGDEKTAGAGDTLVPDAVADYNYYVQGADGKYTFGPTGIYYTWAQTRRMDASGNYQDFQYFDNTGELYLTAIYYTGKKVLPGQSGSALVANNSIVFGYGAKPDSVKSTRHVRYLNSNTSVLSLSTITVNDAGRPVRHYWLDYNGAGYGGAGYNLMSVQECADATVRSDSNAVCYPATRFDWSNRDYKFVAGEEFTPPAFGNLDNFDGYKLGDVDGDGLQDMVRLKDNGSSCSNEEVVVAFSQLDANGKYSLVEPAQKRICTPRELVGSLGKGESWFLFDYDGDGRDDIFAASNSTSGGYLLYKSQGRPANSTTPVFVETNLVNGLLPHPSSKDDLAQLGDLNGDGLTDVIYKNGTAYVARLMERNGSSYGWGAPRALTGITPYNCPSGQTCTLHTPGIIKSSGNYQLYDFDGDSRSDLLLRQQNHCSCDDTQALVIYRVFAISASTITMGSAGYLDMGELSYDDDEMFTHPMVDIRFGDFNGDGLSDIVYRKDAWKDRYGDHHGDWYVSTNIGAGYFGTGTKFATYEKFWGLTADRMQIVDVNGDGRDDVLHINSDGMYVYYGVGTGGFNFQWVWADQALMDCGDSGCEARYTPVFSDFDGDGGLDLLRIKWQDSDGHDDLKMVMFRSAADKRYLPRDAIVAVTDGLGARTDVAYLPLTLKDQYRRDLGSRNAMQVGRGSPVQDVLAPMYVVNSVKTDAPTAADAAGKRTVYYRYGGAKMQAGGRGFLGFDEVTAIDTAYAGKSIATTTTYRQDFPFIGRPLSQTTVVTNAAYVPGQCASPQVITATSSGYPSSCFAAMSGAFTPIAGTKVSETVYDWTSPNFVASTQLTAPTQIPVRVQLAGTDSESYDLATGARLSRVSTDFTYDAWDNALTTTVRTDTGAGVDPTPSTKTTTSTFLNDATKWQIGRLLTSSVAHARTGSPTITRKTAFTYDALTGLLTSERIDPNGSSVRDLRTEYVLDAFGNRLMAFTCSQNVVGADCQNKDYVADVWASTTVHRYTRQGFDARGRFVELQYEPFRKAGTAWGTGERQERVVLNNEYIDKFGNMTHWIGLNGEHYASSYGAMGRKYWSWTQTVDGAVAGDANGGVDTFTTYRNCTQVACPTGAAIRVREVADATPTKWTYFDKLGRAMLVVNQTQNYGVADMDLSAVCTWYDAAGRVQGVSTPFFLAGTFNNADPSFATQPCLQAARDVTYSFYDVLGRPTQLLAPDASSTTMAYTGLTTTTTNALSQVKIEAKNAVGELVRSTDNLGLVTNYGYDATGNLTSVTRNAGRGDIVTRMEYDTLGRRTKLIDPDAGTRTYSFNAAGEQLTESDGTMWAAKRYDFKGRVIWEGVTTIGDPYEANVKRNYDLDDSGAIDNGLGQLTNVANTGHYRGWQADATLKVNYAVGYSYDGLGRRIATATIVDNGTPYLEATEYNRYGRPFKQQDATGRYSKTQFNSRGFAIRVCDALATDLDTAGCAAGSGNTYYDRMQVDARGNVTAERRGGSTNMVTRKTYDPQTGALLTICAGADAGGCQIVNDSYTWDDIGNLQSRSNVSFREHFQYDGLNRLKKAWYDKWNGGYYDIGIPKPVSAQVTYDALGNICSKLDSLGNYNYSYAGAAGCGLNGLPGSGTTSVSASPHAVSGLVNVGTGQSSTLAYDVRGNQTTITKGTATERDIKYTLADQAYEVTRGTRASRFWYGDGGVRYKREDITIASPNQVTRTIQIGNVEIVTGPSGAYTRRYLAGGVAYQQITGTPGAETTIHYYLHQDHLGNIVAVTNASGTVMERLGYSAFGDRISLTTLGGIAKSPSYTKRGFTGHEQFELLNVVHMNGRIYDPTLGRFLQVDPVVQDPSNGQNYNRYTYVWNNPLAYTDPTGMISVKNLVRQIVGIYVSAYLGSSTNIFGSMAGGTFANSVGSLVGSYVAGGKSNIGLQGAFSYGSPNQPFNAEGSAHESQTNEGGESTWSTRLASADPADGHGRGKDDPGDAAAAALAMRDANAALFQAGAWDKPFATQQAAEDFWAVVVGPVQARYGVELGSHIYQGPSGFMFGLAFSSGHATTIKGFWDLKHYKNLARVGYIHTHPNHGIFSGMDEAVLVGEGRKPPAERLMISVGPNGGGDLQGAIREGVDAALVYKGRVVRFDYQAFDKALNTPSWESREYIRAGDFVH